MPKRDSALRCAEPLGAGDGGMTCGVDGRPFVGAHGVEQNNAGGLPGLSSAKRCMTRPPKEWPTRM